MIVLDTNVLSELMLARPEPRVVAWADRQALDELWTTTATIFEIRFGIDLLPAGSRSRQLDEAFRAMLDREFGGRVLAFDRDAALAAGRLAAFSQRRGRTTDFRDVQIAGIVAAQRATLATRNIRHFDGLGLKLVDPWRS